jgi:4-hydroxy-tetrahydrodipicolinate reductase
MEPIKVVVYGASGRVGQEVIKGVADDPGLKLAGAVDLTAASFNTATESLLSIPGGSVPFSTNLDSILHLCHPNVVVDFSNAKATMSAVRSCAEHQVNLVIGTTGLSENDMAEMEKLAKTHKIGIVMAPNFALGAVLMVHLAKIAGKFMDNAEIIELHHDKKLDAPSGTSLSTAKAMSEARGKPFLQPAVADDVASRGLTVDGISIHSVRLPGLMAHQEVILGASGQTLRIRHDTINRECYVPGVVLAIKEVVKRQGLIYGLDSLLGL